MAFLNTRLTLFAVLGAIEEDLRTVVISELASGEPVDQIFDAQALSKCQRRFIENEGDDGTTPTLEELVVYSDLGDLYQTLNANRRRLSQAVAQYFKDNTSHLERLVPIRNSVCHIRPISFEDLPTTFDLANHLASSSTIPWMRLRDTLTRLKDEPEYVLGLEMPTYVSDRKGGALPSPDFDDTGFLGRRTESDRLLKLCLGPYPVITIVGEGGIGKSALALKIAYEIIDRPNSPFDAVVWTSSKTTQLTANEILGVRNAISDSLGVLVDVATQLSGIKPVEPLEELLEYLREFRVLVVLDNLETVLDDRIRHFLEELPAGSKVLITSRIGVGAYEYPIKLEPLESADAIQLLRASARARGVAQLTHAGNQQLGLFCQRLHFNPGFIKWFVSTVQAGCAPEHALAHPEVFLDFCMSNVYQYLDSVSRVVLRSMLVVAAGQSQAELAFLNDLDSLQMRKALQQLLTTNMVAMTSTPRGHSFTSEYNVSELARGYLNKHHPLSTDEYRRVLQRSRQLTQLKEEMHATTEMDPYSVDRIAARTPHDLVIAKYLRDALRAIRARDFPTAELHLEKAKDLSPDYHEVHRVEAWLRNAQGRIPAAKTAYEAAIQLAPESPQLHFWFGGFLLRINETQEALEQLRQAVRLDPNAVPVQLELARAALYLRQFDDAGKLVTPLLANEGMSERNQRKLWDLTLQIHRREAEHHIAEQSWQSALSALECLREAYVECPKPLIDRRMMSRLESAGKWVGRCLRFLADEKSVMQAIDLQTWFDFEAMHDRRTEIKVPRVGDIVKGRVHDFLDRGAVIEVEYGVRALLPRTEVCWEKRRSNPADHFKVGDRFDVMVVDAERSKRGALYMQVSRRRALPNPWDNIATIYPIGTKVIGVVTEFLPFGAMIELETGFQALVHDKEVSWTKRKAKACDTFHLGDRVEVTIEAIDVEKRKIRASYRAAQPNPWHSCSREFPEGTIVAGTVVRTAPYGVLVELPNGCIGLAHSKDGLPTDKNLEHGEIVSVKVLGYDSEKSKIFLGDCRRATANDAR